jgi:hypothetical protein
MGEVVDPGFVVPQEERQRIHAAIEGAGRFFRAELLKATGAWPVSFLRERGMDRVLVPGASWKVGYAPDSYSRLTDYLQKQGFAFATLVHAGLMGWTDEGAPIDRHRDHLMLVSRDQRLQAVGFVGINRDGRVRSLTPTTAVHRPSNALVGLQEQIDLLHGGATPVIVDHPVDAMAIEQLSRSTEKEYVGIPLCESPMSTAQARLLRQFSETDRVIVMLPGDRESRERAVGCALDLAFFFDRIRVLGPAPEPALSGHLHTPAGQQQLRAYLSLARPLVGPRHGFNDIGNQHTSLGLDDPGPDL